MRKMDILPGQRFRTSSGTIWEVQRIPTLDNAPRHVVLVDVSHPKESKMIAESALLKPHLYQPTQ